MTSETPALPEAETASILALLGLKEGSGDGWARLRTLQQGRAVRSARARLAASLLCVMLSAMLALPPAGMPVTIAWALVVSGIAVLQYRAQASTGHLERSASDPGGLQRMAGLVLLAALAWLVPTAGLALVGSPIDGLAQWTVLATLCAILVALMPAPPLSAFLYNVVFGIGGAAIFAGLGRLDIALLPLCFHASMALAVLVLARAQLRALTAEDTLEEKSEVVSLLLREFEDSNADWLWQIDTARRVCHVSPRFAFALGREASEVEGKSLIELIAGGDWESGNFATSLHDLSEKLKRRESFSNLLVKVSISGHERWWELSASPKVDEDGVFQGFRGVGSDVTAQRESADKISHLARFDTLTGLPNRLQVTEALAKAMADAEHWRGRCGFLMIDLDRFKAVNDTLGHLVGDRLLARVSQRLRSIMGEGDLCGRLGGDEFAVVIRDASDQKRVDALADAVIETLSRPYEVDHHTLFVGASVGSAIGPRDGRAVETLMRNADLALYRSKDEGGGKHFRFEPKLHAHAEERRRMEFAMRNALANNEFSLAFQPVVTADSEDIVGFEALLRWNNVELGGAISPAKFIPLAEEARLIIPIGEWVMMQACREAMKWAPTVKVAVNVSGEQLCDADFAGMVVRALASSGLPPQRLEIEVTESIFLKDGAQSQAALDQMLALGVGLALDDFGTGYSSLGYLRKTRFSTIKIDRSFVQGAARGTAESIAIIRAVVAMADSLGMSTTAEGAETEHEVQTIRRLGCRKIQGYYFGRPMAAADAEKLFVQQQRRQGLAS